MRIGVLALLALTASSDVPQSVRDELREIALVHQTLQRYDVAIDVRYEGTNAPVPIQAEVMCIEKSRCIRAIGNLRILQTPQWSVAIDRSTRTMTVAHQATNASPTADSDPDPDKVLSAWLAKDTKVSGGQLTPDGRHWVFQPADPSRPPAELYTDPRTHLIRRILYQSRGSGTAPARVSLTYSWKDPSRLNDEEFTESHYIVSHADRIEAASSYATYRILRADRH